MPYKRIEDRIQDFVFEVRIWEGTQAGSPDDAIAIPFPIRDKRLHADRHAQQLSLAIWGYCVRGYCDDELGVRRTIERMQKIFDCASLAAIDDAIADLSGPLFGTLVRRSTRIMPGTPIQDFCTELQPGWREKDAVVAADRALSRLASA